jgi:hypothetical protein
MPRHLHQYRSFHFFYRLLWFCYIHKVILVRNFLGLWWPLVAHDSRITAGHLMWRSVIGARPDHPGKPFPLRVPPVGNGSLPGQGIGGSA